MKTLTIDQQATWDALISHPVPFTTKQMSQVLYDYLCDSQIGDHAYGEDGKGNSMEIAWSSSHEEWQVINRFACGTTNIHYDGFWEESWVNEDLEMLYDMCQRLNLIDELECEED